MVTITHCDVAWRNEPLPFRTREMVATETPALAATSLMVTRRCESRMNVTAYIRGAYATAQRRPKSMSPCRIFLQAAECHLRDKPNAGRPLRAAIDKESGLIRATGYE